MRRMAKINQEMERDWEQLMFSSVSNIVDRFRANNTATYIGSNNRSIESDAPTLLEAMDFYLSQQGSERPKGFFTSTKRATAYLCESVGNKPIDQYVRADANTLRDYLINKRCISANSAKRVISSIKALIAFTAREHDIPTVTAFLSIHFAGTDQPIKPRHPVPVKVIKELQMECLTINDPSRLLIALISDTGMRLNEALGLVAEDIVLNTETPYLCVKEHPWRRLKNSGSERLIPLIGASLVSARRLLEITPTGELFPKYCNGEETKSNSASAALNKWMKPRVPNGCVIHSFRHSFRDRLREINCPVELVDELGGWSKQSIGQRYGSGYSIETKLEWLKRIALR
jgi:integrase